MLLSSADAGYQAELPGAPRVGADLRAARERIGAELAPLARALRIRQAYLEAIEEGRVADLPGNAYAVGFLRTYAAALGLDPDEVVRRFRAEAAEVNRKTELTFPAPVPDRGVPAGAVVLLGVVLAVGAYAGWYRLSGEGRLPAEVVAPVPERLKPLVQQAVPPSLADARPAPAASNGAGGAGAGSAPSGSAVSGPVADNAPAQGVTAPDSITSDSADSGQTGVPAGRDVAAAVPPPMIAPVAPSAAAAASLPLPSAVAAPAIAPAMMDPATPRLLVRATADSWVQVRDPKTGQILLNKVLHPGDSWSPPADSANLLLTTGNAGGTELVVDGAVAPVLGGPGVVRRDMPLDPAVIKDGKLPAQQAAAAAAANTPLRGGPSGTNSPAHAASGSVSTGAAAAGPVSVPTSGGAATGAVSRLPAQ